MLVITKTTLITLLVTLVGDVTSLTDHKDLVKNNNDSDMLREILKRIDKMQGRMDQMERTNNKRLDQMESNMNQIQRDVDQMDAKNKIGFGQLENYIKNISVVMETIVEQQMVITAEIFTVSQTLPYCCCQYQNTTDRPEIETTTTGPGRPETTTTKPTPSKESFCAEAMGDSGGNGVYKIHVKYSGIDPFDVYCMKSVDNKETDGIWLVIQRRQDNTTDFYQNWDRYKRGFGDLEGNFWIGLDKLHALTIRQELWIQMEHSNGTQAWALYNGFDIGDETELYALQTLGSYRGTAGDGLSYHRGANWSSYDKDNDNYSNGNCAEQHNGAWWFKYCSNCNLNGMYGNNNFGKGITWNTFNGYSNSLKYVHMAIRPRQ